MYLSKRTGIERIWVVRKPDFLSQLASKRMLAWSVASSAAS